MTVKIGINGFGRIGRNFLRAAKQRGVDLDFVAVNDITDAATLAHLLKYDSVLGTLHGRRERIRRRDHGRRRRSSRVLAERDPANLPGRTSVRRSWSSRRGCSPAGRRPRSTSRPARRRCVISAPAKGEDVTIVMGVNDDAVRPGDAHT